MLLRTFASCQKAAQPRAYAGTEFISHDFHVVGALVQRLKRSMAGLSLETRDVVSLIAKAQNMLILGG